jgi:UDP-glucose 4-epimerase
MPSPAPTVLLTGATGYIASHTWLALWSAGFDVVGLDSFVNSSPAVLERLARLGGRSAEFVRADVNDAAALDTLFDARRIDAVVHFAALKAVGESCEKPLLYWRNNVGGLLTLLETMQRHACPNLVFSSSATVYGTPDRLPIAEDAPRAATSPYGQTKLAGENLLADLGRAAPDWAIAVLRYFNPVGAHESGLIGEDPRGTPNNLMPYIAQVAVGRHPELRVFGGDYETPDGTGVRDYIHVVDLAEGHVAALRTLLDQRRSLTVNLGTGAGTSVLELVRAFERASGRTVPYRIVARRPGDVAACWADPALAHRLLGWRTCRGLDQMCVDSWRWQSMNPNGFAAEAAGTPA